MQLTRPARPDADFSAEVSSEGRKIPQPSRPHLEAPLVTLFGVVVVWSSLVIVFTANRLSETYAHFDTSVLSGTGRNNAILMSLDPQVKILLPFSMFVPRMTPAKALQTVGSY